MGGREERLKKKGGGRPDPRNQEARKREEDERRKGYGPMDKAVKTQLKRERERQLLEDEQFGMQLLGSRCRMQFYRALTKMADGTESDEDVNYVASKIDKYERVMERFEIRRLRNGEETKVTEITTSLVDLTPPNSQNSS